MRRSSSWHLAATALTGAVAIATLAGCKPATQSAISAARTVAAKPHLPSRLTARVPQVNAPTLARAPRPALPGGSVPPIPVTGLLSCTAQQLTRAFQVQPSMQSVPEGTALMIFTNTAAHPCLLHGTEALSLLSPAGKIFGSTVFGVTASGGNTRVVLGAGGSMYLGLHYISVITCPSVDAVQMSVPGLPAVPGAPPVPVTYAAGAGTTGPIRVCPGAIDVGQLVTSKLAALKLPAELPTSLRDLPAKLAGLQGELHSLR